MSSQNRNVEVTPETYAMWASGKIFQLGKNFNRLTIEKIVLKHIQLALSDNNKEWVDKLRQARNNFKDIQTTTDKGYTNLIGGITHIDTLIDEAKETIDKR